MDKLCPRCSSRLFFGPPDQDVYYCFLGHRITGKALHRGTVGTNPPLMSAPKTQAGDIIPILAKALYTDLNSIKAADFVDTVQEARPARGRDLAADIRRQIFAPRKETPVSDHYATQWDALLKLVEAGLLTKEEGRLVALDSFPQLTKRIADQAIAAAAENV